MPPWLSPLYLIMGKDKQFGSMVFLEIQEINLQGNMRGSKCDEYIIFLRELFHFPKKFLFLLTRQPFFGMFLPSLPLMFSTDLSQQYPALLNQSTKLR